MLGPKGLAHIAAPATDTTQPERKTEKKRERERQRERKAFG